MAKRAGTLQVSQETIAELLRLPEGTRVRDIMVDRLHDEFTIVLEDGDWLPEQLEGQAPESVLKQYSDMLNAQYKLTMSRMNENDRD